MKIVKIEPTSNGAHDNQTFNGVVPEGYAIIPDDIDTINFPFGEPVTEVIDGLATVVRWIPGIIPAMKSLPTLSPVIEA